jgi:hypothetical protein
MDHTQLKNTAKAIFGFIPEWTPKTCDDIITRTVELDTIPAVYLRAVVENLKIRGCKLRYANVILSRKYEEFIPEQLQLLQDKARVRLDSDMVEFRSAMLISKGNHRDVLEDVHVDISCLGKYWISKMYGFDDLVTKFAQDAALEALANPFLEELYKKLQEDAK